MKVLEASLLLVNKLTLVKRDLTITDPYAYPQQFLAGYLFPLKIFMSDVKDLNPAALTRPKYVLLLYKKF